MLFVTSFILTIAFCLLIWCFKYSWFAENRMLNDTAFRSHKSWNNDHEFFETITEYRNELVI